MPSSKEKNGNFGAILTDPGCVLHQNTTWATFLGSSGSLCLSPDTSGAPCCTQTLQNPPEGQQGHVLGVLEELGHQPSGCLLPLAACGHPRSSSTSSPAPSGDWPQGLSNNLAAGSSLLRLTWSAGASSSTASALLLPYHQ